MYQKIKQICAQEILDSRGNPTVEAAALLEDGTGAFAAVPSGASTGIHEALELRDNDSERYMGRGVLCAVENVNSVISPALSGCQLCQHQIDARLLKLDGTADKSELGANATLAVSLACAKAAAQALRLPLYRLIGGINACRLPVPMMNVINGGAHAANNLDIQEFMIMPEGFDSFSEALRAGSEIYHVLGKLLRSAGLSTGTGDEGGYAPDLESEEAALDFLVSAIEKAGYDTDRVRIAIDAAAGEWYGDGMYTMPKSQKKMSAAELCAYWEKLSGQYPIASIEDGMDQDDTDGWKLLTDALSRSVALVGDDLFVTNTQRLKDGICGGYANAILIKPNQIGTLTQTLEVMRLARESGYRAIVSHRSGDTEDTSIADIAVGMNAGYIKCGAPCRSERTSKYNRLLRIEAQLAGSAVFGSSAY